MIRKVTKVKHGGRIYESIVVLDSNENIIVPPSLYLTHLSINTSSPLTVYNYSHTLNKYFEYINNEGIDWKEVTDVEMSQFIYDKFQKKQTVKENTVEVYATVLEGFYKWAWTSEQLTHPIKFNFTIYSNGSNEKNRKKYKVIAKALVSQYIKKKKFFNLLEHLKTTDEYLLHRNELILYIAYYMGLRRNEITDPSNFTIDEIKRLRNNKNKTKYLSIFGKGAKSRKVLVVKEMEDLIFRHFDSSLFPNNAKSLICSKDGKPISGQVAYLVFRDAAIATKDPYWDTRVLHSFRHTYATNMITTLYNSGQQNYHTTLSNMMGHTNEETTNIYISFEDFLKNRNSLHGRLSIKPKYFKSKASYEKA